LLIYIRWSMLVYKVPFLVFFLYFLVSWILYTYYFSLKMRVAKQDTTKSVGLQTYMKILSHFPHPIIPTLDHFSLLQKSCCGRPSYPSPLKYLSPATCKPTTLKNIFCISTSSITHLLPFSYLTNFPNVDVFHWFDSIYPFLGPTDPHLTFSHSQE